MPSTRLEAELLARAKSVRHGHVAINEHGTPASWRHFATDEGGVTGRHQTQFDDTGLGPAGHHAACSLLPRLPESVGGRDCTASIDLDTSSITPPPN